MSLKVQVRRLFSPDGVLARSIPDFRSRPQQVSMAEAVADAIEADASLIVEAGTGTGKTFAYLVPALASERTVLVSTASKNLQSQLVSKDIPQLRACFPDMGDVVLLKGRENYVCQQRLTLAEQQAAWLPRHQMHQIAQIRTWLAQGGDGDRAHCEAVPEEALVWQQVCAQSTFCQAAGCEGEGASACPFPALRQRAQDARVVVVNHHLLAADLALRAQGRPGVLPRCDVYVIDEAHHLPQVLQQFFGAQVGAGVLRQWAEGLVPVVEAEAPDMAELKALLQAVPDHLAQVHAALPPDRTTLSRAEVPAAVTPVWDRLMRLLDRLAQHLKQAAPRATALEAAFQQLQQWRETLAQWWTHASKTQAAWLERTERGFRCLMAPLDVSDTFEAVRTRLGGSWIFTSATLNATEDFAFFRRALGLWEARSLRVDSPFDHARQGLIYHPPGLPDPGDPDYVRQCMRRLWPLLQAAEGRALLLFSSRRAMEQAAALVRPHWPDVVLMQGERSKPALLAAFRRSRAPLLFATASFWEGVDLPGDQLRLVAIDRIPFRPPDDPLLQAQEKRLQEKGLSAFALLQLPQAALALKQGAGRLIRGETDRGVLVLCDPRLTRRHYGRQLRDALPPFPWTQNVHEVCAFLRMLAGSPLESPVPEPIKEGSREGMVSETDHAGTD